MRVALLAQLPLAAVLAFAATGACGGARRSRAAAPSAAASASVVTPTTHKKSLVDADAPARARAIATIGRRAIGPFAARAEPGGLVAWVTSSPKGSGQDLEVVPLDPDGLPLAPVAVATSMPDGVTSLVVRPSGSPRGGWLVAWSALMDRGEALTVLALDSHAVARGAPVEIQRTSDHLSWFDLLPTPAGAMSIWAEETSAGGANLVAVAVDSDGKAVGLPARVARDVARWDVATGPRGSTTEGLALVDLPDRGNAESSPGKLSWTLVDGEGRPRAAEVAIGTAPNVSSDVDAVAGPAGGWLLGWTDRTAPDAQVTLALVDAAGHVQGPTQPLEAAGSSSLVSLVSGAAGSLLAWESPRASAHSERELRLAEVSRDGAVAPTQRSLSLAIASRGAPEVVPTDSGFALLVVAHACLSPAAPANAARGPCAGPLMPMLVRLGASLEPVQTEPVLLGDDRTPAALAWGLACIADHCSALAADGASPTTVYDVDFAPRASHFSPPVVPPLPPDAPRLTGLQTIASGQVFADLVAARIGDDTLLATLALPKADGPEDHGDTHRKGAGASTIALYALDVAGHPFGPPTVVSARAVGSGGLAMAPALRADDGAAIAWVKRDGGDPQIHLAHVDRRGKRLREVQLTSAKGDASSVSIVAVDGGWLVAWVDARDGGGQVYATRVDTKLDKASREERITTAAGDPTDVALAVTPGDPSRVWLAWSDSRESPSEGLGDIYMAEVRAQDARRSGDEVRVLATAHHSRSPQIVPWPAGADGGGALVAWLEEGPAGLESPSTVMFARVDAGGHRVGDAVKLPMPAGSTPTSVSLAPEDGGRNLARVLVARSAGGVVSLGALRVGRDGVVVGSPSTLLDLEAEPPFEAAGAISGDAVFFDDVGGNGADHRVRRASVDWRKAALAALATVPSP